MGQIGTRETDFLSFLDGILELQNLGLFDDFWAKNTFLLLLPIYGAKLFFFNFLLRLEKNALTC